MKFTDTHELTLVTNSGKQIYSPKGFNKFYIDLLEAISELCECSYGDACALASHQLGFLDDFTAGRSAEDTAKSFLCLD